MKIALATLNTVLGLAMIWGILFAFGLGGGWSELDSNSLGENLTLVAGFLVAIGIVSGWIVVFKNYPRKIFTVLAFIPLVLIVVFVVTNFNELH